MTITVLDEGGPDGQGGWIGPLYLITHEPAAIAPPPPRLVHWTYGWEQLSPDGAGNAGGCLDWRAEYAEMSGVLLGLDVKRVEGDIAAGDTVKVQRQRFPEGLAWRVWVNDEERRVLP